MNEPEVSQEESQQFLESLRQLASQWRQTTTHPAVQQLQKAGRLTVSPLVENLLSMNLQSQDKPAK